jgi:nitroreductase
MLFLRFYGGMMDKRNFMSKRIHSRQWLDIVFVIARVMDISTSMNTSEKSPIELILGRRSIRVFKPGEVSDAQLRPILEAAMSAPSAVARDPWRFIVIRQRTTLKKVAEILPHGKMIAEASLGIIVCGDLEAAHDQQLSYLLQDCSAAIENLLLAAHGSGLGAVWLGIHPRVERIQKISELMGLPKNVLPVAGIALGHPGEIKEPRTRYREECMHYERW